MKLFNVILVLTAITLSWLSKANTEDKIFLTIFFSIALGFWLVAMHDDRKRVA